MVELCRGILQQLLEQAHRIVSACRERGEGEKIVKMSSHVLFELKHRRDLSWMEKLLNAPYASDMGKDHWNAFREEIKKQLPSFQRDFPQDQQRVAAWLYFLGWLHRLANLAKSTRARRSSSYRRQRRFGTRR